MIAEFLATEAGTHEDVYFLATGVACSDPPHHLMFSRSLPIGGDEDWGIEIEYDDQSNAGCRKIQSCLLRDDCLRVELIEPIDREKKYTGFEVKLQLSESKWNSLASSLRTVFRGHEAMLSIEDRGVSPAAPG